MEQTIEQFEDITISPRGKNKNPVGKVVPKKQLKRMDLGPMLRVPKIPLSINPVAFKNILAAQPVMDDDEWTAYFETKYSAIFHPQFITRAIDEVLEACRTEKKLLLIFFYNDDLATKDFCGTCLSREELATFTDEAQIPMWVTRVDAQFAKKFSEEFQLNLVFPFVALVGFQSNRLRIYDFITDLLHVSDFINILKKHLEDHNKYLAEEKSREWERQQREILTQEQNVAYQKSLEEDNLKQIQKKAEEEHLSNQLSQLSEARQAAILKLNELPPEPPEAPRVVVVVRLLDGARISRKFSPTDTLQMLFDFIGGSIASTMTDEGYMTHNSPPLGGIAPIIPWSISNYDIVLNYPKRILPYSESSKTLKELGLPDQLMCFLSLRE